MAITIELDEGRQKLGFDLKRKLDQYIQDRLSIEQQWIKNLRQYRGKYDPDMAPPEDRSQMYPKDTRVKVKGFVAKMMELMFPATENNWELQPTPVPSISQADLQRIIGELTSAEQQEAMEEMDEGEMAAPEPLESSDIEKAVREFALERAQNMEREILDQLADMALDGSDYPQLCKRVLRSGAIFGIGVAKAPLVRKKSERVWQMSRVSGTYEAVESSLRRPYPVFVKVWDIYPDLSALTWEDQEGLFERMVFNRHQFTELAKRPGFDKAAIKKYLMDHAVGNYKAQAYETTLQQLNNQTVDIKQDGRKYEVYRWYGYRSAHDLKNAGIEVADEDMDKEILTEVWMIDEVVIMSAMAPFGDKPSDVYHAYIYSEDEDASLVGVGMPEDLRDSQMGLCASTRAMYDNMAATAGPMLEVAVDLMKRNSDYKKIHSFKVFEREGEGQDLANPAIRTITHQSHIPDIMNIIKETRAQLDIESNLPSWTMGNTQQLGEAFRTSRNMSMLTGGANIVPKDAVRAFDRFTTSIISAFVKWNMEFNDKEDIKGDFNVLAKGNFSLVAKEVRGAALDQFVSTLDDDEKALLKKPRILKERLRVRDLPVDIMVDDDEAEEILAGLRAERSRMAAVQENTIALQNSKLEADTALQGAKAQKEQATLEPAILEILARIDNMEKTTKIKSDQLQLQTIKDMLENLVTNDGAEQEQKVRQADETHQVAMTQRVREQAMKERQADENHQMNVSFRQRDQAIKEKQAAEKPAAKKVETK